MFYTSQAYNVESTSDSFDQGAQYSLQHTALSLHDTNNEGLRTRLA